MKRPEPRGDFPIEIDVHQCTIPPAEADRMRDSADLIARQVEHFPVASMHVLIEHNARTNDYNVKTDLFLSGETLVCGERDAQPYTAFERCLEGLTRELEAYKGRLEREPERQKTEKGTHQTVQPSSAPDMAAADKAAADGDYAAFRTATFAYEDSVRMRAGRWVERYPQAEAQVGKRFQMDDIVEEVFLDAFEKYGQRPRDVRLGEWLEHLIDPAVKGLMQKTDAELENIGLARSARAAEDGADAV